MSLKAKLLKNSTIELTSELSKSTVFDKKDMIPTPIPAINIALSGIINGGLSSGLTCIAGPSRHYKTNFALLMANVFLKKYPEGLLLFYDSEFGAPQSYFEANGIDTSRVIHTPIKNIEELKHDIVNQLENITREDKVIIIIDSAGNLASKKEVEDAISGNSAQDMTRAKQMKSLARIITPYLSLNDIPMIAVMHVYQTMEIYSKSIMSGGTGFMLASDNIWILGRQQEKDSSGITGYNFVINIEKSRYVKEKSKIPITVSYEHGILKYSGLLDIAIEGGFIEKPKNGWYAKAPYNKESDQKMYRENDLNTNKDFWLDIFRTTDFCKWVEKKYKLGNEKLISNDSDELKEILDTFSEEV